MFRVLVFVLIAGAVAWVIQSAPPSAKPPVTKQDPVTRHSKSGSEYRIEARITDGNRCMVRGVSINGRASLDMLADSGAPDLWLPVGDLPKIGIARSSLAFHWWDAREGNVAAVTLPEVRIGDFVARNVGAFIGDREDMRLLGMSVLKQGRMEIEGDTCVLTFPANVAAQTVRPDRALIARERKPIISLNGQMYRIDSVTVVPPSAPVANSLWCGGNPNLPPVPSMCAWVTNSRGR